MGQQAPERAAPKRFEARLVAIGGSRQREYPLRSGATSVGTAPDNDIVVEGPTVSRYHAVIRRRLGGYAVFDLESTNGTFVNGIRIRNPTTLRRGDDVRFGAARFAFMLLRRPIFRPMRSLRPRALLVIVMVLFAVGFVAMRYRAELIGFAISPRTSRPSPAARASVSAPPGESAAAPAAPAPLRAAAPEPEWLALLNWYRKLCKLDPVVEDSKLSAGDRAHVQYLIANYADALRSGAFPGEEMHEEREGSPGYTPEGAAAGKQSDVDFLYWHGRKPDGIVNFAIRDWMSGAFHRLPLLTPDLQRIGYYDFCGGGLCVAAMNATAGAGTARGHLPYPHPIQFPPEGSEIDMRTFGNEWPDPLTGCPGYAAPTGLPITLTLGNFIAASLGSFRVERIASDGGTQAVEACGFDSATYTNPDARAQAVAREVLRANSTVVVILRRPLTRGASYRVRMTVNGGDYDWKFGIAN
jgi:hypothetical protein